MNKKAAVEEFKFVKISEMSSCYEALSVPDGATHVEAEIDYSDCFYENDAPSVKLIFYKREKVS